MNDEWTGPPPRLEPLLKPGGGTRWMTRLSEADGRAYTAAAAQVAGRVEASLSPQVFAERLHGVRRGDLTLRPWEPERLRLRRWVDSVNGLVLVTDIRECFPSITADAVARRLQELGARQDDIGAVDRGLRRLAEQGVPGLPIGPIASAVLANAVLGAIDEALRATGFPFARWVDDIFVATDDRLDTNRAHDVIRRAAARVGLEIHEAKTERLHATEQRERWSSGRGPSRWPPERMP